MLRQFTDREYYHVYNRGVDKRLVFMADEDRKVFLGKLRSVSSGPAVENPHVTLIAYCLMDNHYHLLLRQESEGGISKCMQRLGISYTRHINRKYKRSGTLFESSYKIKHVDTDGYLAHIIRYIHLNVLDILTEARESGLNVLLERVRCYRWSDADRYFIGRGELSTLFDDISYRNFLYSGLMYPLPENKSDLKGEF